MTIDAALYSYLSTDSGLVTLRSTRIYPFVFPQESTIPVQVYQLISSPHERIIRDGTIKFAVNRYQITTFDEDKDSLEALANATLTAILAISGTVNSNITIRDGKLLDQLPDYDSATALYSIRQDFSIWHEDSTLW